MTTQTAAPPAPWRVIRVDDRPGAVSVTVAAYARYEEAEEVAVALNEPGEAGPYKVLR